MDASEVLFPPLDSPEALSEYARTYYSYELDADYRISLKGNNLSVQISENLEPGLIEPEIEDKKSKIKKKKEEN